MSVSAIAFAKEVAALSPALTALLEDHMKDNFDELLPHLFIGDVTRHVIELMEDSSPEDSLAVRREVKTILAAMEAGCATGTPEVQELIAASFLENVPTKEGRCSEISGMLGPKLASQWKKMT